MQDNFWQRAKVEIGYWTRKEWSFEEVSAHWDATLDYDDINAETYSYFRRFTDGLRLSDIPENSHVLDITSRTGNGTLFFYRHRKFASVVCADVSEKMGEICKQRLLENGLKNFKWVQIFDYDLPFKDQEFDAVLFFETVEHFDNPAMLINELARVTKAGGTMILTTPNILWEPIHALATIIGLHHSEGPHRFIRHKPLLEMVKSAGFEIATSETTVLVPAGPDFLIKIGEWTEQRTKNTIMHWFGLRRVLICTKK